VPAGLPESDALVAGLPAEADSGAMVVFQRRSRPAAHRGDHGAMFAVAAALVLPIIVGLAVVGAFLFALYRLDQS
jgi:hypothetical protein